MVAECQKGPREWEGQGRNGGGGWGQAAGDRVGDELLIVLNTNVPDQNHTNMCAHTRPSTQGSDYSKS